jgi:hypothetical protein
MTETAFLDEHYAAIRRRVRLIVLLRAAEGAGLTPLPILRLHTFAYLTNVLAPVWHMTALDAKLLKRQGGPFYPALQADLDRLVGLGVASVTGLRHVRDNRGKWRLEGSYSLNEVPAAPVLAYLQELPDERAIVAFVNELALALSVLSDADLDGAMREDATYSDPMVTEGNVIDFGEWANRNYSANAAETFSRILPAGDRTSPGEKLHLYVRHLQRRMHGAR